MLQMTWRICVCIGEEQIHLIPFTSEKEPKNFWHISRFGEIGIAKKGPGIKSKMANPGIAVMYLGHAKEHGREVYRLLNIETKRVMMSRDVRWLDKNYTSYKKQQGLWDESEDDDPDDVSDDDIEQDEEDINMEVDNMEGQVVTGQTRRATTTTSPENRVTWADVVSRPATRSTTRASEMARALEPVQRSRNAALIRQMASLSGPGIYRNPVAETVLDEARQQEQALKNQLMKKTKKMKKRTTMKRIMLNREGIWHRLVLMERSTSCLAISHCLFAKI